MLGGALALDVQGAYSVTLIVVATADGTVGGTVPPTLSLSAPASFGAFTPGVAREYAASTSANVISTAGDATLSAADPDTVATGSASPTTLKTWANPVSNDAIGATDALRTGTYSKT